MGVGEGEGIALHDGAGEESTGVATAVVHAAHNADEVDIDSESGSNNVPRTGTRGEDDRARRKRQAERGRLDGELPIVVRKRKPVNGG